MVWSLPPSTCVAVQTISCMESSGVIHGPPEPEQPEALDMPSCSPRRWHSLAACSTKSSQCGVSTQASPAVPSGSPPCQILVIWAPLRPMAFMASRSFVMPSLVTLSSIQCHQVRGREESGGLRNSVRNDESAAQRPANGRSERVRISAVFFMCFFSKRSAFRFRGGRRVF